MIKNSYDRMLAGQWYDAGETSLENMRQAGNECAYDYNLTRPGDSQRRRELLSELLGEVGSDVVILPPLWVDYGKLIQIGAHTFINHGAYLMDGGGIHIGKRCQIGPYFGAYTAAHPLVAKERATGYEKASPIVIEDDVWIGANVTILPGVTIGAGAVIGAGSVVTKDVPAHMVAYGNPCRVVRAITDDDRVLEDKNERGAPEI